MPSEQPGSAAWRTCPVCGDTDLDHMHTEAEIKAALTPHVERPTKMRDGKTYCSCGRPWPCEYAEVAHG